MRAVAIFSVMLALGSIEGCSCEAPEMLDDMGGLPADLDVDAYLWDHDGMAPPGVDLAFVPFPDPDGGIVVTTPDGGTFTCFVTPCQGKVYQCGNCMDDDGDGLVDSLDPDCLGPCQNNEAGLVGNIPGQNNAPCKMDCYWDQDTGSGNDKCEWDHRCDPKQPTEICPYDPNTKIKNMTCDQRSMSQPDQCKQVCGKQLTPNGCDCFGCCANPKDPGGLPFVYVGSTQNKVPTCTYETLTDPTKCRPCTQVPGCKKDCDRCQLCFGKTAADLPADCFQTDGGTPHDGGITAPPPNVQCPGGEQPCGLPGQDVCPPATYCITGCCQSVIF